MASLTQGVHHIVTFSQHAQVEEVKKGNSWSTNSFDRSVRLVWMHQYGNMLRIKRALILWIAPSGLALYWSISYH